MAKRKKGSNSGQRSRRGNGSRARKLVQPIATPEIVTPEMHGPTEPQAPLPAGGEPLGLPVGFLSPRSLGPEPAPPAPQAPSAPARGPRSRPGRGAMRSMSEVYEALAAILVPYALQFEAEMHPRVGYCLKAK